MNIRKTLDDVYDGNLKTVDQIKKEEQDREQTKLKRELRWEETLKEEGVRQVLRTLNANIQETHEILLGMALSPEVTDAQVRNYLVRYSTLCRTKNAVTNNNEII